MAGWMEDGVHCLRPMRMGKQRHVRCAGLLRYRRLQRLRKSAWVQASRRRTHKYTHLHSPLPTRTPLRHTTRGPASLAALQTCCERAECLLLLPVPQIGHTVVCVCAHVFVFVCVRVQLPRRQGKPASAMQHASMPSTRAGPLLHRRTYPRPKCTIDHASAVLQPLLLN